VLSGAILLPKGEFLPPMIMPLVYGIVTLPAMIFPVVGSIFGARAGL
jgi:hypothetical protein